MLGIIKRVLSTTANDLNFSKIRNIGIIAHIDAGKTTTTERMLFYSGMTKKLGDVDRGDTIMDYMPEERERGITITAACITFGWKDHKINLIDTPGHVDFTIEVERSVRVLDGAVAIIDGVSGVEPQTETVWRQICSYEIPRIVYVNKLDRMGASFDNSLRSVEEKLNTRAIAIQRPVFENDEFVGIVDLVKMKQLFWNDSKGLEMTELDVKDSALESYRSNMLESIAEFDDLLLDMYLENPHAISSTEIINALRRITRDQKAVVVLCGSSFKNIGVQPLLDAVIDLLPNPAERPPPMALTSDKKSLPVPLNERGNLVALAYKVVNDIRRGLLIFVRVYSGILDGKFTLYNSNRKVKERVNAIYNVYADKFESVDCISAGNIGIIVGPKNTFTGDTLQWSHNATKFVLSNINIPSPVCFYSIEPYSLAEETEFNAALESLQREDPSIKVELNKETGQTILSGMGELHLEIALGRLRNHFKVNVMSGGLQISYKESILEDVLNDSIVFKKEVGGKMAHIELQIKVQKLVDDHQGNEPKIQINRSLLPSSLNVDELSVSIHDGFQGALSCGPNGYPVCDVVVSLERIEIFPGTPSIAVRAAAYEILKQSIRKSSSLVLEPIAAVSVNTPNSDISGVISDIHCVRNGQVKEIESLSEASNPHSIINALIPFEKLIGYSSALRSLTAGKASFSYSIHSYKARTKNSSNKDFIH